MSKMLSGEEFIKLLSENKISEPITMEGMAKPEDGETTSFMFSVGTNCTSWVRIPLDIVENIEVIRILHCKDHTHPFIRLFIKEPPEKNEIAGLFINFVRQISSVPKPIIRLRGEFGKAIPTMLRPTTTRFLYRMCFYDPDGQYVGSSVSEDLAFLDRQCQNFKELHPGGDCQLCE